MSLARLTRASPFSPHTALRAVPDRRAMRVSRKELVLAPALSTQSLQQIAGSCCRFHWHRLAVLRAMPDSTLNVLTSKIIACAIAVHRALGPGLLESVYLQCLIVELRHSGLQVQCNIQVPIFYRGMEIECGYRLDLLVENLVIIELKAVAAILPVHEAQLLTYLKLTGRPIGLLLNFNVPVMKDGIVRKIHTP